MIDLNNLLKKLTNNDIINILIRLGADRYEEKNNCIVFPTICHNLHSEEANMKLYYYFNNNCFVCYTECDHAYNLFSLIDQRFTLLGKNRVEHYQDKKTDNDYTFYDIIAFILDTTKLSINDSDINEYTSQVDKYLKHSIPTLPSINSNLLSIFNEYYCVDWIKEDISINTMKQFNIKYSIVRNSIIIPHYNLQGDLIGIRERNLDPKQIEQFGKYRPVDIEGNIYAHPLSLNLYGLNIVGKNINKLHKVIIVEGEKSVLKSWEYYGNDSIMVASCGSHINKNQVKILIKNFDINEIIIAYDKEYETYQELSEYSIKMKDMCNKYTQYCNFSFIKDTKGLLGLKDSPIDRGKEIFERLLKERVKI